MSLIIDAEWICYVIKNGKTQEVLRDITTVIKNAETPI